MTTMNEEKSVLRWGGLAGILGSVILIIVFGIVIIFVGEDPAELEGFLTRFPSVRTARTIENALYSLTLVIWVAHYLSLFIALRKTSPAPALFGTAFGILGLSMLLVNGLPHVATSRLAVLYHSSGITPADKATLVLAWQATQGLLDSFLIIGLAVIPIGLITLGAAMLGTPAFGKGYGWLSLAIGVAGFIASILLLIDPRSMIAVVTVLGMIFFHLILGWKVSLLSRS